MKYEKPIDKTNSVCYTTVKMKEQQTREGRGSRIKPHKREKIHSTVTNQAEKAVSDK